MRSARVVGLMAVVLAGAGLAARPAVGQEAQAPVPTATDALPAAIDAIKGEYAAAQQKFQASIEGLQDEAAINKAYDERYPQAGPYVTRMESTLAGHEAEPAAAAGLAWIVQNAETDATRSKALESLHAHHLASPEMLDVVRSLAWDPTPASEDYLGRVSREAPGRDVQGEALFALAQRKIRACMADPPDKSENAEIADQLLGRVRQEYGDVASGKHTFAERVVPYFFELRHLRVGMTAPDIEGTDVEGATFRLSEYRGKVVVLDFWGFW
jgi:hypothetical protein